MLSNVYNTAVPHTTRTEKRVEVNAYSTASRSETRFKPFESLIIILNIIDAVNLFCLCLRQLCLTAGIGFYSFITIIFLPCS